MNDQVCCHTRIASHEVTAECVENDCPCQEPSPCYFCNLGWQIYDGVHLHPQNLGWVDCDDPRFDRRARAASSSDEKDVAP